MVLEMVYLRMDRGISERKCLDDFFESGSRKKRESLNLFDVTCEQSEACGLCPFRAAVVKECFVGNGHVAFGKWRDTCMLLRLAFSCHVCLKFRRSCFVEVLKILQLNIVKTTIFQIRSNQKRLFSQNAIFQSTKR